LIHPEIKLLDDNILRTKAVKVTVLDQEVIDLIQKMFKVMDEAGGIGLAANQIGSNLAIFVTKINGKYDTFINAEIIEKSDSILFMEGCLSIPGVKDQTNRFNKITMTYLTPEDMNYVIKEEFEGLPAVVMQHETDHLNGKLYIDSFAQYRKSLAVKKYKKTLRRFAQENK